MLPSRFAVHEQCIFGLRYPNSEHIWQATEKPSGSLPLGLTNPAVVRTKSGHRGASPEGPKGRDRERQLQVEGGLPMPQNMRRPCADCAGSAQTFICFAAPSLLSRRICGFACAMFVDVFLPAEPSNNHFWGVPGLGQHPQQCEHDLKRCR